jgi:hypothetical protein
LTEPKALAFSCQCRRPEARCDLPGLVDERGQPIGSVFAEQQILNANLVPLPGLGAFLENRDPFQGEVDDRVVVHDVPLSSWMDARIDDDVGATPCPDIESRGMRQHGSRGRCLEAIREPVKPVLVKRPVLCLRVRGRRPRRCSTLSDESSFTIEIEHIETPTV